MSKCLPMHFRLLSVWLLWILCHNTVVMAATLPEERMDAIGTYRFSSRVQCEKLCWYRQLCTSFSHTTTRSQGTNCVLHSNHVEDSGSDETSHGAWNESSASRPSASGGCDDRPCDMCSFCVRRSDGGHDCLQVPTTCPDPHHAPQALVVTPPASPSSKCPEEPLECAQPLEQQSTAGAGFECQADGRMAVWTGECVQAVFYNPAPEMSLRLPSPMADGWKACVQGVFTSEDKMSINFLPTAAANGEITLHLDFRRSIYGYEKTVVVDSLVNHQWLGRIALRQPPMALDPGDSFTLNIRVTVSALRMTLNNDVYEVALSELHVDITNARFVQLGGFQPQYVNLAGLC